jgi:16S rRNA (adenine1518-N6/adenine1519-N6)-dimethyltransferase
MDLSDLNTVRAVLARHGFHFSRSLGQNFIVDPGVCPKMADLCGASKETGVLEVGPGFGVLTKELSARAAKVVAVELDRSLEPVLKETLAGCANVRLVWGDVMKLDLRDLIRDEFGGMDVAVCANLPYYITSPVVMRILEEKLPVSALTVMVQEEAAGRLCAEPGTRACGAVSISVQYYSEPKILFGVPRSCFYPQPNVDSAVIRLDIRKTPPVSVREEREFFALVRTAFCQRRKTAVNAISAGLSLPKERVADAFARAGISPTARAERLTMSQLAKLTDLLFPNKFVEGEKTV